MTRRPDRFEGEGRRPRTGSDVERLDPAGMSVRRWAAVIGVGLLVLAAGCAAPIVLEHPVTRERVNCTEDAQRLAVLHLPRQTGTDVPRRDDIGPVFREFDYVRQCAGRLQEEGFICISGCPAR
jgi:hypothetical protein